MKDRRQELIQSEKKRNSIGFPNTPKNKDRTPDIIRKKNSEQVQNYLFQNSERNYKINNKYYYSKSNKNLSFYRLKDSSEETPSNLNICYQ